MTVADAAALLIGTALLCTPVGVGAKPAEPSAFTLLQRSPPPQFSAGNAKAKRSIAPGPTVRSQFSAPIDLSGLEVQLLSQSARSISLRLADLSAPGQAGAPEALISLAVPKELHDRPVLLQLTADDPTKLNVEVRTAAGALVTPIAGLRGRYLLDPVHGGSFTIRSALTLEGSGAPVRSAAIGALIEPGPILFGRMQVLIHKGTKTSAYPQVGSLLLDGMMHCTATLVAPHTALTAAHCVAGYEKQIADGKLKFATGPIAVLSQNMISVTSADYPKGPATGFFYSEMQGYRDDIALVYLGGAAAASTALVHHGTPDWSTLKSQELLFVGYGYNGDDLASAGFKREASWKVDTVQPRKIAWATHGPSTCQYDSGGPAFIKGTMTVAGVTSMGAADCSQGIDTRVDAFWSWLSGKLR